MTDIPAQEPAEMPPMDEPIGIPDDQPVQDPGGIGEAPL